MPKKLKLCPFCGGKARAHRFGDHALWTVYCSRCGVERGDYLNERSAITAWNRRVKEADNESDQAQAVFVLR